jgi:hypothetical protein
MASTDDDQRFVDKLSLSLLALDLSLKFTMSNLRMNGAVGEGNVTSFFEKFSKIQLLTSEYVPVTILLMKMFVQRAKSPLTTVERQILHVATWSRFIFALRAFDFTVNSKGYHMVKGPGSGFLGLSMFGFVGATSSYVANSMLVWLTYKLIV